MRKQFRAARYLLRFVNALILSATLAEAFGGLPLGIMPDFPEEVNLKAAVLTNTVPLAWYDENYTISNPDYNVTSEPYPEYRGFQPDLLRHLIVIAKELDNVTLNFDLEEAPPSSHNTQFEYLANDCGFVANQYTDNRTLSEEECSRLDLVIGDYSGSPTRSIRTVLTPSFATTAGASIRYIYREKRVITTLQEAQTLQEPVCLLEDSHFVTLERYPDLVEQRCTTHDECLRLLKGESCALFLEDQLQLRYFAAQDVTLQVTPESFNENLMVWPLSARLDPLTQQLIIRWMYQAKVTGVLDELDQKYFRVHTCPLGLAGPECDKPCDATNGVADRYGNCVCDSTRWTGDDCSVEVIEDKNIIPDTLKIISYVMLGINYTTVAFCAIWLFWHRNTAQVKVAQPLFLCLMLTGCFISSSTILALGAEDEGNLLPGEEERAEGGQEELSACMAIPWLYSMGFSLTVGSLFAKIRRVYLLFHAAATLQRRSVTATQTFYIVVVILITDVIILTTWTVMDPLYWHREPVIMDKYGYHLETQGHCTSDHYVTFGSVLLAFHFTIMGLACHQCYIAREIPTKFSEGKFVTIAMISNLQIFVVAVPVLIILGTSPQTSFFVRSVIIWMNDFVVLVLIFGNLMFSVHGGAENMESSNRKVLIRQAMSTYQGRRNQRKSHMIPQSSQFGLGLGFSSYNPTPSIASYGNKQDSQFDSASINLGQSNHKRKKSSNGSLAELRESDESESSSSEDDFSDERKSDVVQEKPPWIADLRNTMDSSCAHNTPTSALGRSESSCSDMRRSVRRVGIRLTPTNSCDNSPDPSETKAESGVERCPDRALGEFSRDVEQHSESNAIPVDSKATPMYEGSELSSTSFLTSTEHTQRHSNATIGSNHQISLTESKHGDVEMCPSSSPEAESPGHEGRALGHSTHSSINNYSLASSISGESRSSRVSMYKSDSSSASVEDSMFKSARENSFSPQSFQSTYQSTPFREEFYFT